MKGVVEVTKADQRALARLLNRKHGSITEMQETTGLSRRAIINARDLGRVKDTTLVKIKTYLAQQNAGG